MGNYIVQHTIVKRSQKEACSYFTDYAEKAKLLYNASLFRIRQCFTGWKKEVRSENEEFVFNEIELLEKSYPEIKVNRVIAFTKLEKLMRVTNNPDFFSGLPMQTAQAVVKQAVQDFRNWLAALKDYKENPQKYLSKPKMPKYKKACCCTFTLSNQDAVLYGNMLKLPKTKTRVKVQKVPDNAVLKEVKVIPYYGNYIVSLTLKVKRDVSSNKGKNFAGIDFGVDNIVAIVTTDGASRIYKGGAILSENQFFAKGRAKAVSRLTRGGRNKHPHSRHIDRLSYHRSNFVKDQLHKISTSVINFCAEHDVKTLVLGVNKFWKQYCHMRRKDNQNFVQMPIARLRWLITYKAALKGIAVVEHEESYTSKASFIDEDFIPTYSPEEKPVDKDNAKDGKNAKGSSEDIQSPEDAFPEEAEIVKKKYKFSGYRMKRGLYKSKKTGHIINADLNGAANILRKAIPEAWNNRPCMLSKEGFHFLKDPEVIGFHCLNPQNKTNKGIPVEGIVGLNPPVQHG